MLERRRLVLGWLALAMPVAGCGFRPVYSRVGDSAGAVGDLAAIHVALIPERPGQLLRLALQERLERGGTGVGYRYELRVALNIVDQGIAIQTDNSVTRDRLIAAADFTLFANDPLRPTLLTGSAHKVDGFDQINQEFFAADLERDAIVRRLTEALADQISLQLAAYFRHRSATPLD